MARVANRSSPLMETLGGFAVALAIIYGGWRGIEAAPRRASSSRSSRISARVRAGETAGAAQHGSQQ